MNRADEAFPGRGTVWLAVAFILGLVASHLLSLHESRLFRAEMKERIESLGSSTNLQLEAIGDFIRYTTDGVWVGATPGGSPSLGPPSATVEVLEFVDLLCPACARLADSLQSYLEVARDVRLVVKHYPLTSVRPESFGVAVGAACANQTGQYWRYASAVYSEQAAIAQLGVDKTIEIAVRGLGMDSVAFARCLLSDSARNVVDRDRELGMRLVIFDTPTFFVNGKRLETASWPFLRAAIEWERRNETRSAGYLVGRHGSGPRPAADRRVTRVRNQ